MNLASSAATTSTVSWWYVAALAGGFTLLGAVLTQAGSYVIAGRKNKLDDARRFDGDIIQIYMQFNDATDVIHNNAGGDPKKEFKVFWDLVPAISASVERLELIASPALYRRAERFRICGSEQGCAGRNDRSG